MEFHPEEPYYIISSNCEIKIEIRIKPEDSNAVEARREVKIPTLETTKITIIYLSVVSVTAALFVLGLAYYLLRIFRKRRCEQERMRGDNYQSPEIFA